MNRPSFNALTEPWIPVIRMDGSNDELSLWSCLEQAPELREIRDPSPIIEFGIYRLLVAFVLDALILTDQRPEDPLDLKSMIEGKRFDLNLMKDYVEKCGDVFDLFHPERPFLQTKVNTKAKLKSLAGLYPVVPSGTNVNHWQHSHEDDLSVSAQMATRLLTTISPFMTAGGAGLSPSINGAPPIYALPFGKALFETIILNIPLRKQDSGKGLTAWRTKRSPGRECTQATTVEAMTWRPRKIQLIPEMGLDDSPIVRKMKFEKGDSTRLTWIDGSLAYRFDKNKVTPIRMRENRPIWRDAGPLLLLNEADHAKGEKKVSYRRADVVEQAFTITDSGNPLVIQVYGMRTDMKMKIFEWVKSALSIPAHLGQSTRLGSLVDLELRRAEQTVYRLQLCIKALYPREGAGNKGALATIKGRCERAYWKSLEPRFYPLMTAFAALDSNAPDQPDLIAATAQNWRDAIRTLALEQFERAAQDMDANSDALERQVLARNRLHQMIRKVLS